MNVTIQVTAEQTAEGETAAITQTVTGELTAAENGWRLCYDETGDLKGTHTVLSEQDGMIRLRRTGTVSSDCVFEQGKRHAMRYDIGCAILSMSLFTRKIQTAMKPDGGTVELDYLLYTDGNLTSRNKMKISVIQYTC